MRAFPGNDERMSVLHQDSRALGGIGKSIPSTLEISLGHGFCTPRPSGNPSGLGVQNPCPREISQDFPRPSRFPSGFALGKSLGSREILGVGDGFSNPSLLLVEHGYNALVNCGCRKHRHRRNVTSHHSLSHLSLLYFNFFNFHH